MKSLPMEDIASNMVLKDDEMEENQQLLLDVTLRTSERPLVHTTVQTLIAVKEGEVSMSSKGMVPSEAELKNEDVKETNHASPKTEVSTIAAPQSANTETSTKSVSTQNRSQPSTTSSGRRSRVNGVATSTRRRTKSNSSRNKSSSRSRARLNSRTTPKSKSRDEFTTRKETTLSETPILQKKFSTLTPKVPFIRSDVMATEPKTSLSDIKQTTNTENTTPTSNDLDRKGVEKAVSPAEGTTHEEATKEEGMSSSKSSTLVVEEATAFGVKHIPTKIVNATPTIFSPILDTDRISSETVASAIQHSTTEIAKQIHPTDVKTFTTETSITKRVVLEQNEEPANTEATITKDQTEEKAITVTKPKVLTEETSTESSDVEQTTASSFPKKENFALTLKPQELSTTPKTMTNKDTQLTVFKEVLPTPSTEEENVNTNVFEQKSEEAINIPNILSKLGLNLSMDKENLIINDNIISSSTDSPSTLGEITSTMATLTITTSEPTAEVTTTKEVFPEESMLSSSTTTSTTSPIPTSSATPTTTPIPFSATKDLPLIPKNENLESVTKKPTEKLQVRLTPITEDETPNSQEDHPTRLGGGGSDVESSKDTSAIVEVDTFLTEEAALRAAAEDFLFGEIENFTSTTNLFATLSTLTSQELHSFT
ncbi:mucin-2-like [Stomoxys calcitrans]|uniref:mucin-2-like n=1 Tax=Stomoxys calcitrans TaxID=35570 RepID=UPI0027E29F98|nr:mucin-2-like [Stomoxys calcitrans]